MNLTAPPQDQDAETALIGTCLMHRSAIDDSREIVNHDDFYRPAHEAIWASIVRVHSSGEPVDPITVSDDLRNVGMLERVGGVAFIHELAGSALVASNAPYYAHIVADTATRRRLLDYATGLAQAAASEGADVDTLLSQAGQRLDLVTAGRTGIQLRPLSETMVETLDRLQAQQSPFAPSPWPDLDAMIHGWGRGTLNVLAARPGGGKSLAGLQAALMMSRTKLVTYAVLEMGHHEVNLRLLAQSGNVSMGSLAKHNLSDYEWTKINKVTPDLMGSGLYVDPTRRQTTDHIRAHARSVSRLGELGMIVVDYIQQVDTPRHMYRSPRYEQIGHVTSELKTLAFEFDVPVLAMAQIKRTDPPRPPILSDLRESGNIESDADTVIGLHRANDEDPDLECHVLKARQGRLGQCLLGWQAEYARLLPINEARGWSA